MWATLKDYWQDFKAGRERARYFAASCLLLVWLIYMGLSTPKPQPDTHQHVFDLMH